MGRQSAIFITLLLLIFLTLYLITVYSPGQKELPSTKPSETLDCRLNVSCFLSGISDCRKTDFELPHPFFENESLDGSIVSERFGDCEIRLNYKNESMLCYLNEDSIQSISSTEGLRASCSGELLDSLTPQ